MQSFKFDPPVPLKPSCMQRTFSRRLEGLNEMRAQISCRREGLPGRLSKEFTGLRFSLGFRAVR